MSKMPVRSMYDEHGNNEPYIEPNLKMEPWEDPRDPRIFVQLIQGPSTNIYVGPEEVHFTIPKRLLYRFSDFAKKCLEGDFFEARANAIWLPDVRPDVFQWLCQWLYTGSLDFLDGMVFYRRAELLCQMHMLGERLLFIVENLEGFKEKLSAVMDGFMECVKADGRDCNATSIQWMADIMYKVLSGSARDQYDSCYWRDTYNLSLRSTLLSYVCNFDFYTRFDFRDCGEALALDGAFAAAVMGYLERDVEWAVELWGAQTQSSVNLADKKIQYARENGDSTTVTTRPREPPGRCLTLRYTCTERGCTSTDFQAYVKRFESDGSFAAEKIDNMVTEMEWVVERWGRERGRKVDVAQEKDDEERCINDYDEYYDLYQTVRYNRWSY